MLLYSLLDRVLPRSYLAKVFAVVVVFGYGPLLVVLTLHGAGRLPEGAAWPAVAMALGLGLAGAAIGLAAILRPVARLDAAFAAFERGEPEEPMLPDHHDDDVGRLMARAVGLIRTAESRIDEAKRQAEIDPLTGLLNRRGFERALAERGGLRTRGALLMLDLDHFKSVNDDHGHDVGDHVLRDVAALLRDQMRRPDIAARFGGEEFVIYLAGTGREPTLRVAERLRMAVEDRIAVAGRSQTASFGVAAWPPGAPFLEVLKRADAAVYEAKAHGRNCVRFAPGTAHASESNKGAGAFSPPAAGGRHDTSHQVPKPPAGAPWPAGTPRSASRAAPDEDAEPLVPGPGDDGAGGRLAPPDRVGRLLRGAA